MLQYVQHLVCVCLVFGAEQLVYNKPIWVFHRKQPSASAGKQVDECSLWAARPTLKLPEKALWTILSEFVTTNEPFHIPHNYWIHS